MLGEPARVEGIALESAAGGDLVIVRPWLHKRWWRRALIQLPLTAVLGYGWYRLVSDWQSIAIGVVLALISAFLLLLDWVVLSRFVNRTTIRVNPREITVTNGPLPAFIANRRLAAAELAQLFCHKTPYDTYEVRALAHDGKVHVLVELLITPEQARFVEQQVERALGIVDRPVEGQLTEAELAQKKTEKTTSGGCLGLALFGAFGALLGGMLFFHYRFILGEELGSLHLGEAPASLRITVPADRTRLVFWNEMEVTLTGSLDRPSIDDVPHIIDYVITVESDGAAPVELRCNAFDSHVFDWSSRRAGWSEIEREWKGRLERCSVDVPAGELTVRAHRAWLRRTDAVVVRKSVLIPMAYRP